MKGAMVLAVAPDDPNALRDYANAAGLTFPIVVDRDGRTLALYGVAGLPKATHDHVGVPNFFIDKGGITRDVQIGALNKKLMQSRLEQAMQADQGRRPTAPSLVLNTRVPSQP